ncbi:MAG: acyl-CoA dehydrogenase family protein [Gammaproteobacteria bacterium]|nr:acyl-CoA dehydrogenase family protein [Gammaproteobacteria bacterium]
MSFRSEVRSWLDENCPASCRGPGEVPGGGTKVPMTDDQRLWLDRCAERGFSVPTWPEEYGGAGLDKDDYVVLLEEMRSLGTRAPVAGMGTSMIGPTLLEYGTDDQKARHLPRIARGEVWWCQGYSEPGSGSDLASLRTRAEDHGDHFVINGQKIWTSGAFNADWIFCLTRTDPDVPKHDGISFLLFTMHQPGVTVRPIRLISGASPFCETFFDNAIASKEDLVGGLNRGWTVAKRLLQHERSGISMLASGRNRETGDELDDLARQYAGESDGRIADPLLRDTIAGHNIDAEAFRLTQRRTVEESEGNTPGPATSIFKYYGANLRKQRAELQVAMMGTQGVGWDGDAFNGSEIGMTRQWLAGKAGSIAGGSNEVQLNIIAKRVLGLPD